MLRRSERLLILAVISATVGTTSCQRPGPSKPAPLNFLVVTIDTLRADRLRCYGYFRDTSPHLDALAREAIFFERCLVPMATTLPTHLSLFTGLYPIEHGVLANVKHGGVRFVPSPELQSFVQVAGEAGYSTAAFISATPLKRGTGIEAGFEVYDQPKRGTRIAEETNEKALAWLAEPPDKPFFLWVHYFDPHDPYEPPPPFDTMFETDESLERYLDERKFHETAQRPQERGERKGAVVHARRASNHYDGEVRYTDEQIGRLFDQLKKKELWDRTVVVVIGDHGEGLNQHGEPGHGLVWQEQVHVPFMVRVPGQAARKVAHPVSVVDVFPTVLAMTSVPGAENYLRQTSGTNVLGAGFGMQPVFSQSSERQLEYGVPAEYALTGSEWKFIHVPEGTDQLYRLTDDPHELNNVIADHAKVAETMRAEVLALKAQQEEKSKRFQAASAPAPSEFMKELRDLGYAGDGKEEKDEGNAATTQPDGDGEA